MVRKTCVGEIVEGINKEWPEEMVGRSDAFLAMTERIPVVAKTDVVVLIRGETGTGKELCARAIHYLSPRAGGPFVVENCGRLPADLIANEFFGHEIGAYTGASGVSKGLIGQAQGGTLVLDEVDSLPPPAQAVLLRFLQDRRYQRLGGSETYTANVRIVASTNQDLGAQVQKGHFRRDLYHRLKVAEIVLPSLRERNGDLEVLTDYFVAKYARKFAKPLRGLGAGAMGKLLAYQWPGNVRELEDVIEEGVLFAKGFVLNPEDLNVPEPLSSNCGAMEHGSFKAAKAAAVRDFEVMYLSRILAVAGGNITKAALAAGIKPGTLWNLLRKHDLLPSWRREKIQRPSGAAVVR